MTDIARLSELITARFGGLVLYARQFVDDDIADDVVQTALVALLSQRKSPADPMPWMYRAVRNAAIDAARARARRRRREQSVAADRSDWFEPSMDEAMDAASAEAALRQLPADLREVVVLRLWGDLGFAEIADLLNISVSTAREYFAKSRHISVAEASKRDIKLVMATYFIEQYQIAADEQAKILDLPLNETIELAQKMPERLRQLGVNSSNIGCILAPALKKIPITFGRAQRQIAALAAIQALRAYAADHGGQLPATLADVLETPVPVNPMSGKMFEYRLENGTASISDTESLGSGDGYSLVYTLRISKP